MILIPAGDTRSHVPGSRSPRRCKGSPTDGRELGGRQFTRPRLRGVSIRGVARDLGMSRNTVRRYLEADGPEMVGPVIRSHTPRSDTLRKHTNGRNP